MKRERLRVRKKSSRRRCARVQSGARREGGALDAPSPQHTARSRQPPTSSPAWNCATGGAVGGWDEQASLLAGRELAGVTRALRAWDGWEHSPPLTSLTLHRHALKLVAGRRVVPRFTLHAWRTAPGRELPRDARSAAVLVVPRLVGRRDGGAQSGCTSHLHALILLFKITLHAQAHRARAAAATSAATARARRDCRALPVQPRSRLGGAMLRHQGTEPAGPRLPCPDAARAI